MVMLALCSLAGAATAFATTTTDGAPTCCARAVRVGPQQPIVEPPASNRVAIIGDSLIVGVVSPSFLGAETLDAVLRASDRSVFTSAAIGRTVTGAVRVVLENTSTIRASDVALVGLGTNDIFSDAGGSVAASRAEIDRFADQLWVANPDLRIGWADVSVEKRPVEMQHWNTALDAAAAADDRLEICRWRNVALANPNWSAPDGIHLVRDGYAARRDVLLRCLISGS